MVGGRGTVLVAGGGGFIGGHLTRTLCEQGFRVRSVDKKPLDDWYQILLDVEARQLDLSVLADCREALRGIDTVYNLAADMGGMGFIETHKADCMLSVLINTHLLIAAQEANVGRFFFSSSACVYAADKQVNADVTALNECDAYPAMPEDGYGWEKLFSERMCRHFREDFGLQTRVARYHNVYGVDGTFDGGREKAPAALCRKIATAALTGCHEIEVWGDGEQTRSFMYVDDCIEGTLRITAGDSALPVNVGSSELVSINQMVSIIEQIAGITVKRKYNLDAPKGVRGRNSDNTLIKEIYGWEPSITLADGLERTYRWIFDQLSASGATGDRTTRVNASAGDRTVA
ncbi:NAD-dependent epimerase/dehydratase family protein [Candidatus Mycobacterium methanotrophicum]|uniref:NAD-dependent epimerase/dehydratase family protein n=1 Tax=Candidatus Mycobacterium methanotrophicum TaxID=2943498 RepID=A0ABY4QMF6_9MYCO|nr:NAD-dependent epimerase/dehydratase family protein [Candidatus Mycobacterium methanotrophicum]UQX12200.1 NAD-dependent epimerase/dehydratase family protein [Candidatus Mycobacterium methanotrophicum]